MAGKVHEATLETLPAGCKTPQDVAALYTQMLQRVAIREASKRWRGVHHWKPALQVFRSCSAKRAC